MVFLLYLPKQTKTLIVHIFNRKNNTIHIAKLSNSAGHLGTLVR